MNEIKTSAFCGLSRSEDFQNWLKLTSDKLYNDLINTIRTSKGCRANSNKMMDIYFELNKDGKGDQLTTFLKRRFPWILKDDKTSVKEIKKQNTNRKIEKLQSVKDWDQLNKHKVFKIYRPDILSFPQKLIMVGDPAMLYNRIQRFVQDKLAIDYIIVEDHAYIEYFDMKYAAVVDKIARDSRDIYQYRKKIENDQ